MVPGCLCAGHPAGDWGKMGGGGGGQGPVAPPSSSSPLHRFLSFSFPYLPRCSLLHRFLLPVFHLSTGVHLL